MSFLEMTKWYLIGQENVRIIGDHFVKRIMWETKRAIVFLDSKGYFWRYLRENSKIEPAVIMGIAKSENSD
jgi:hypothetical protein